MTKSDLIKRLAKKHAGLYQKDIARIVEVIFEEMCTALVRGDRIELRGFGAFSVRARESRLARNPRTNQVVKLNRRRVPYFRSGKELRLRINENVAAS